MQPTHRLWVEVEWTGPSIAREDPRSSKLARLSSRGRGDCRRDRRSQLQEAAWQQIRHPHRRPCLERRQSRRTRDARELPPGVDTSGRRAASPKHCVSRNLDWHLRVSCRAGLTRCDRQCGRGTGAQRRTSAKLSLYCSTVALCNIFATPPVCTRKINR